MNFLSKLTGNCSNFSAKGILNYWKSLDSEVPLNLKWTINF